MINYILEKLIVYAQEHLSLPEEDVIYVRNDLMYNLRIQQPYVGPINVSEIKAMKSPDALTNELREQIKANNLIEEWRTEGLVTQVLGYLTPAPSIVKTNFWKLYKKDKVAATNYLYDLGIANNYIQKSKIEENIKWRADFADQKNYLDITINLAKPEKDNKQIALDIQNTKTEIEYPLCPLCRENVGFGGSFKIPPRQNLRIVYIKLDKENWFIQYSPYVYYDKHCIVIFEEHKPMVISPRTFANLVHFVDLFPHFFVGTNSDLPIVGGSILSHEHFQGGSPVMPMFKAKKRFAVNAKHDRRVEISVLDWFTSVIELGSRNKNVLLETANKITQNWLNYENKDLEIIAYTDQTRHNTVTPIVRKDKTKYLMYLVLRNNRTNEEHPDGIFHAHKKYHNIKKEGIGLIEQMGLFILPARLKRQLGLIEQAFVNKVDIGNVLDANPDLTIHQDLINIFAKSEVLNEKQATAITRDYVNQTCRSVLNNSSVFKNDEAGNKALLDFIKSVKY